MIKNIQIRFSIILAIILFVIVLYTNGLNGDIDKNKIYEFGFFIIIFGSLDNIIMLINNNIELTKILVNNNTNIKDDELNHSESIVSKNTNFYLDLTFFNDVVLYFELKYKSPNVDLGTSIIRYSKDNNIKEFYNYKFTDYEINDLMKMNKSLIESILKKSTITKYDINHLTKAFNINIHFS